MISTDDGYAVAPTERTRDLHTIDRLPIYLLRALLLIVVFGVLPLQAQQPEQIRIVAVDPSQLPIIETTVQIVDGQGVPLQSPPTLNISIDGVSVTDVSQRPTTVPGAVVIVADLSARVSDRGTPATTRFSHMKSQVTDLLNFLQGSDQRAALILVDSEVKVAHDLTNDLVAISNTVNNANPTVSFAPQALDADATTYPLDAAIIKGLDILDAAPEGSPRTLVVLAAGDADQPLDTQSIHARLAAARTDDRPVELLVYSFGSATAGQFARLPAGIDQLRSLAAVDSGSFTPIVSDSQLVDVATKQALFADYQAVLRRSEFLVLRGIIASVPADEALLTVTSSSASATKSFTPGAVSPRLTAMIDPQPLPGQFRLAVAITLQQGSIANVEYLLDGKPLTPTITRGPTFVYDLDTFAPAFQGRFSPGQYELVAAAEDSQGQVARSEPVAFEVGVPPPAPTMIERITVQPWIPLSVLVGILGLGLATTLVLRRNRKPTPPSRNDGKTAPRAEPPVPIGSEKDELTALLVAPDNELTMQVNPDLTDHINQTSPAALRRWTITAHAGGASQTLTLHPAKRNYSLGRVSQERTPDLALTSISVSRNHAKIELLADGPMLTVAETTQGSFFGEQREVLVPGEPKLLADGDIFWLSPDVKLQVSASMAEEQPR